MKPSSEITNYELVDLIRSRSRSGYEILYKNYAQNLYNVIRTVINNDTIAEDLLQDTFVRIWQNIDRYDDTKGSLYTWMLNIARNISIDHVRSKQHKKQMNTVPEEAIQTGASHLSTSAMADDINARSVIERLEPKYRVIIETVFWGGHTYDEAAKKLGIPLGTLKSRARTALQLLKKHYS